MASQRLDPKTLARSAVLHVLALAGRRTKNAAVARDIIAQQTGFTRKEVLHALQSLRGRGYVHDRRAVGRHFRSDATGPRALPVLYRITPTGRAFLATMIDPLRTSAKGGHALDRIDKALGDE